MPWKVPESVITLGVARFLTRDSFFYLSHTSSRGNQQPLGKHWLLGCGWGVGRGQRAPKQGTRVNNNSGAWQCPLAPHGRWRHRPVETEGHLHLSFSRCHMNKQNDPGGTNFNTLLDSVRLKYFNTITVKEKTSRLFIFYTKSLKPSVHATLTYKPT